MVICPPPARRWSRSSSVTAADIATWSPAPANGPSPMRPAVMAAASSSARGVSRSSRHRRRRPAWSASDSMASASSCTANSRASQGSCSPKLAGPAKPSAGGFHEAGRPSQPLRNRHAAHTATNAGAAAARSSGQAGRTAASMGAAQAGTRDDRARRCAESRQRWKHAAASAGEAHATTTSSAALPDAAASLSRSTAAPLQTICTSGVVPRTSARTAAARLSSAATIATTSTADAPTQSRAAAAHGSRSATSAITRAAPARRTNVAHCAIRRAGRRPAPRRTTSIPGWLLTKRATSAAGVSAAWIPILRDREVTAAGRYQGRVQRDYRARRPATSGRPGVAQSESLPARHVLAHYVGVDGADEARHVGFDLALAFGAEVHAAGDLAGGEDELREAVVVGAGAREALLDDVRHVASRRVVAERQGRVVREPVGDEGILRLGGGALEAGKELVAGGAADRL